MADSPEHQFISVALDKSLSSYSETKLLGLREAERRTFDYGCVVLRDFSRPLVSQVLWSHREGIEKDIRTLIFDGSSSLKLYFVRDNVKNRAKIDEVVQAYRRQQDIVPRLRGLRIIPVPDSFDADSEEEQKWMEKFIHRQVSNDLLFAVVFGKLTSADVATFSDHGGPIGLKFAALDLVTTSGLDHGPTFERQIGSRGSPLREALTMLSGTGLIGRVKHSILKVPTLKGRFMLDLSRRLMFEKLNKPQWSDELKIIMTHLRVDLPPFDEEINQNSARSNVANEIIYAMRGSKSQFGRDLMTAVDPQDPLFYAEFDWQKFTANRAYKLSGIYWNDSDDIDLFRTKS